MNVIFKNGAKIHIETADFLCILKADQKTAYRRKILEKVDAAKWIVQKGPPYKHHLLCEVIKDDQSTAVEEDDEEDFDLDQIKS